MPGELASHRRQRYRDDTRRGILDAAEELLVDEGLEAFSMRRLAARCGCAAPTIYHYFRDKTGIVDAVLEERMQALVRELEAVSLAERPEENMLKLSVAFARFGLQNPDHYQLMMMNRDADATKPASGEKAQAMLSAPLDELVRRGRLREAGRERLRQELWCFLHGYVGLLTTRPNEDWVPELLERAIGAHLRSRLGEFEADEKERNPRCEE
jgi:AcrR family transcriptional regulator